MPRYRRPLSYQRAREYRAANDNSNEMSLKAAACAHSLRAAPVDRDGRRRY